MTTMAHSIDEIMNRELLAVRPDLPAREAAELLRSFGVGAAPIVDERRCPLGVVSLRDRLDVDAQVRQVMTRPADCVSVSSTVEAAAEQMARGDRHHLVVVDGTGVAVGMLSTLDVLRALVDSPPRHPATFPHWDAATGCSWTDDWPLDAESCSHAPARPGALLLVTSHRGERGAVVWVEATTDVRARLLAMASQRIEHEHTLQRVLALNGLRFRAARIEESAVRDAIVASLRSRLEHQPPPGTT
jgi:CBS domain-containing protein